MKGKIFSHKIRLFTTDLKQIECNKIQRKFYPELFSKFEQVTDPRNKSYIEYSTRVMLGTVYYKEIADISSMQEMTRAFNEENVVKNLYDFMGSSPKEYLPHGVTENEFLERLEPTELENIQSDIVYRMIRRKTFDDAKVQKRWLVLVDGSELDEGYRKKNDNYLSRKKLKKRFPRLPIYIVADGLYVSDATPHFSSPVPYYGLWSFASTVHFDRDTLCCLPRFEKIPLLQHLRHRLCRQPGSNFTVLFSSHAIKNCCNQVIR